MEIVDQWTQMKQGKAQPLFDVVIQIPVCAMLPYGVCKAGLSFGKTDKTEFGLSMVPMKGDRTYAFADLNEVGLRTCALRPMPSGDSITVAATDCTTGRPSYCDPEILRRSE